MPIQIYGSPGLPELYYWALLAAVCASVFILFTAIVLIWSLLRTEKRWWFSGVFLLLFGVGCWSLVIALIGFQQWHAFTDRFNLFYHDPSPAAVRAILGTAYRADIERCQIQLGIIITLLVLLTIADLRRRLLRFPKRDTSRLGEWVQADTQ